MKKIFNGLAALFICIQANATPLEVWQVGGEFHDVHLQEYSPTSPNVNPEENINYFRAISDNATLKNNAFGKPNPEPIGGYEYVGMFGGGSSYKTITPGSSFDLGFIFLTRLGNLEGEVPMDLEVMFVDPLDRFAPRTKVHFNLLFNLESFGETEDRAISFTQISDDADFSVNGEDYTLSFDKACKVDDSLLDCSTNRFLISPGEITSNFNLFGTLKYKSADVPEPSSLALLLAGLIIFTAARFRRGYIKIRREE